MNNTDQTRVAVLGAGGIGKHHGNWWTVEGAEVCAILGSSDESCAATAAKLRDMFGFRGNAYTNLTELLENETPDIVDVCTPPQMHYQHARAALEAGCSVLCEKPFVYDRELPDTVLLAQAEELIGLATAKQVRFGICTQYVIAAEIIADLQRRHTGRKTVNRFRGILKSPIRGRAPDPVRTWVDLSPHMLGALAVLAPTGHVLWETVQTTFNHHLAQASFTVGNPGGQMLECEIVTEHIDAQPANVRQLELDGRLYTIEGLRDAQGHFCADIQTEDGSTVRDDTMRVLIRRFMAGDIAVPGAVAIENLRRMLEFIRIANEG